MLTSVLNQTYSDWELLLVDDCSTDGSFALIQDYAKKDARIHVFQNAQNSGPGPTRNKAIEEATGDCVAFLDSDDAWLPTFLERSVARMQETKAGFTYAGCERWNDDFSQKFDEVQVPERITYKELLLTCPIICSTAMIHVEHFAKKYMPSIPRRQDYVLWLEYLKEIPFATGINEPLLKYRVRKSSVSSNKWKLIKHQFSVYYRFQKLGLFSSIFYTCTWAYFGFMKYRKIKR